MQSPEDSEAPRGVDPEAELPTRNVEAAAPSAQAPEGVSPAQATRWQRYPRLRALYQRWQALDQALRLAALLGALMLVGGLVGGGLWLAQPAAHDASQGPRVEALTGPNEAPTLELQHGKPGPGVYELTGSIVDGTGLPVLGASVRVTLEDVTPAAWSAIAAPSSREGRFTVQGLVPGTYVVRIDGEGLAPAELRGVTMPRTDATALTIRVSRRVRILGSVWDGKQRAPGVNVAILSEALGGRLTTRTDAEGRFRFDDLPEGAYQVWAWRGNITSSTQAVLRSGVVPDGEVALVLGAGSIVIGRVLDQAAGVGMAAMVELAPLDEREVPRYGHTDADGVFRIEGIPKGRWNVEAFAPGYLSSGTIQIDAGQGRVELEMTAGAIVEGRVVDEHGRAVAGAHVQALVEAEGRTRTYSLEHENVQLERFLGMSYGPTIAKQASPQGSPTLGRVAGFVAQGELGVLRPVPTIPLVPRGEPELNAAPSLPPGSAALDAPAIIAARSVHAHIVAQKHAAADKRSQWVTDAAGRFRIRALSAGTVRVEATQPGYPLASSLPRTVADGELVRDVEVRLVVGGTLEGLVTDARRTPLAGAHLSAHNAQGAMIMATSSGLDGRYTLRGLAGPYMVRVAAAGYQMSTFEQDIPSDMRVQHDVELRRADQRVFGVIEDTRGVPLVDATVSVRGEPGLRATTNRAGEFTILGLADGALTLTVRHASYPATDHEATAGAFVRIRVGLAGGITGQCVSSLSGVPIAKATIVATGPSSAKAQAATDAYGRFQLLHLAPGSWSLAVRAAGFVAYVHEVEVPAADVPAQASLRDLRLELERGARYDGEVVDRDGRPQAGAQVTLEGAECTARSDASGRFSLEDCPAGATVLRARKGRLGGSLEAQGYAGEARRQLRIIVE